MSKLSSQIVTLFLLSVTMVVAQPTMDLGLSGGSSVAFVPTSSVMSSGEFRLQGNQIIQSTEENRYSSLISITAGLSPLVELYTRVTFNQKSYTSIQLPFCIGGKFVAPIDPIVFDRIALWGEAMSANVDDHIIFGRKTLRGGLLGAIQFDDIDITAVGGVIQQSDHISPIGGVSVAIPLSSWVKVGMEGIYGYTESKSISTALTANLRVLPFLAVSAMTGYLRTINNTNIPMFSAGVVFSTADIDFLRREESLSKDIVPSFEEMEKSLNEELSEEKK